mgnify:CR=1 FL=1
MAEAYIIDAVRTPRGVGKPGKGALSHLHPQHLAATAVLADPVERPCGVVLRIAQTAIRIIAGASELDDGCHCTARNCSSHIAKIFFTHEHISFVAITKSLNRADYRGAGVLLRLLSRRPRPRPAPPCRTPRVSPAFC